MSGNGYQRLTISALASSPELTNRSHPMKPAMRFLRNSRGVTVIGYAQIATAMSILTIFGLAAAGGSLFDLLSDLAQISSAALQAIGEV